MKPEDIGRLETVGDPRLSKDGTTAAYVVTRIDMDDNRYRSSVWLVATDGTTPPRPLPPGSDSEAEPEWSPDGTRLALMRTDFREPLHHQLVVVPVDGSGDAAVIDEGVEVFSGVMWSPDGTHLAYARRVRDARLEPEHDRDQPPRRIDSVRSRLDDVGWTVDRRSHVFVAAADGSTPPRQLTEGPFEHEHPSWSPDGSSLAFAAARHDDWDLRLAVDLWVADPSGAAPLRQLTDTTLDYSRPVWSPDGTRLAATATDERVMPHHTHLVVVDVASGAVRTLTEELDRHCAPSPGVRPPIWIEDGTAILFSIEDHGSVPLLRVAADGSSAPSVVLDGERWVTGYDTAGDVLVFVAATSTDAGDLSTRPLDGGPERQLSDVQSEFLDAVPALDAERFGVPSPAGDGDVDTWIVRPPGFDPAQRYPMILTIHGGPMTQYGNRWLDEVQLYASAGNVVVFANPHGSSGDTEAWLRAIRSPYAKVDPGTGWGGIDYEDLMAVVDAALVREPAIDPDRIGAIGGSYGGFMTSWMVGQSNRFAAACSERAVNNLLTLEFTSDLASTFRHEVGVDPFEKPDEFLRQSPMTYVYDIETPVLILHSEHDLRCPIEQADQLFVALRMLGKEVEYWRFPGEGHELSRSGSPKHRVQRAEIILEFFGRHLRP